MRRTKGQEERMSDREKDERAEVTEREKGRG